MVLSPEDYRKLLGITDQGSSKVLSSNLKNMMLASIGSSMVNQEVVVLGTEETQDLSLQVRTKVLKEMT